MRTLELWTLPDSYFGAHWDGYYVFLGQHRDSDAIDRSNFTCALEELGGETETVFTVSENHWAVGWVEWIAIHKSDTKAIETAREILAGLDSYPIVNEDHLSELEWNEVTKYWESLTIRDRIEYLADAKQSIFAARRDEFPEDPSGYIFERLRG